MADDAATPAHKPALGMCCMAKKSGSKSMRAFTGALARDFAITIFDEHMIRTTPVEEWPRVDVLVAFYSDGFPLEKTMAYCKLHPHMVCLNNLRVQQQLRSRVAVHALLAEAGVRTPAHVVVSHGHAVDTCGGGGVVATAEEEGDVLRWAGGEMRRPFVEKPADADDHNVRVYYSAAEGGGCCQLFRKTHDRSSERLGGEQRIRRDRAYVYEAFMPSDNHRDIKVYSVMGGAHVLAEARKAPTVDGIVERDEHGKEVRETVVLRDDELEMARRISAKFGQAICGFDVLRCGGTTVCYDVNGWANVKGKNVAAFYTRAATLVRDAVQQRMAK